MGKKSLAEAIILQSMEDLWDEKERDEAILFLNGGGFSACAEIAGMNFFEQVRLYNMANKMIIRKRPEKKKAEKFLSAVAV